MAVTWVITELVKANHVDWSVGAFSSHLRVHVWCYFIVLIEAAVVFPFLLELVCFLTSFSSFFIYSFFIFLFINTDFSMLVYVEIG